VRISYLICCSLSPRISQKLFQQSKTTCLIDHNEITALQKVLAKSDDQTAYVQLYRIYFRHLLRFARSFVGPNPVAEEIVSDVFLQIWNMRRKLHTVRHLTVYLYTCIRNHSLNHLRQQQRLDLLSLDEDSLLIPSTQANPEQTCITSELMRAIDLAVRDLPPRCRTIFQLVREDGLRYREVAEILNISVKTIEAQMGIAMKRISKAIQPFTGEAEIAAFYLPFQKK
jgi:RNA polymerase sigma-70 factor (family 1)